MTDVRHLFLLLEKNKWNENNFKKASLKVGHHTSAQGTSSEAESMILNTPSCNPGRAETDNSWSSDQNCSVKISVVSDVSIDPQSTKNSF